MNENAKFWSKKDEDEDFSEIFFSAFLLSTFGNQ